MIDTSGSGPSTDSSELSTAQALIASLTSNLADTKKNRYRPRNKQGGRGGDRAGGGRDGRGDDQRPQGVLGATNNYRDQWFT